MKKSINTIGTMVLIAIVSLLFAGCDYFNRPLLDYLEEWTNTAQVSKHTFDGTYPEAEGYTNIPSGTNRVITYYVINPQNYTLDFTVTFAHDAGMIVSNKTPSDFATVEQDLQDKNIIRLTLKNSVGATGILPLDGTGTAITPTITITEPNSGRNFGSYTVPVRVNSLPPRLFNAVIMKYRDSNEKYAVCFNLPAMGAGDIHRDITQITVNGTFNGQPFNKTYRVTGGGTETISVEGLETSSISNYEVIGSEFVDMGTTFVGIKTGLDLGPTTPTCTITLTDSSGASTVTTVSTVSTLLNKIYVNENSGDDNNTGTVSSPVKTIGNALEKLRDVPKGNVILQSDISLTGEVTVGSGISVTVTTDGSGRTVTNGAGRVFNITSGGSLTLGENITLTGTVTNNNGGAVYVNGGTFTMEAGSKITRSSASYGGGVYVDSKGTFTMGGGTISKNSASGGGASGGGASGGGVCISGGTFTMSGGAVISGNTATSSGGGVFVSESGKFTMEGGTIGGTGGGSPNSAENGGGVYIFEGTFTMSDSAVISGNNASSSSGSSSSGGGVYIHNGTFTMSGGAVISGNSASSSSGSSSGGGVYVYETGKFTMEGGTIGGSDGASANSSESGGGVCVYKGTFTMNGGSIQGNKSNGSGGGIYLDSTGGTVTLNNTSSISGNQAVQNGGGVNIGSNGVFTMSNGTISGNTATQKGGGVYVSSTGNFTLGSSSAVSSPVISGNTKTGNSPNNVYLDDTFLSIDGELKKSKEPGNIGISMDTPGEEFTLGWGSSGLTDTTFFFSDDTERNVALSGSELSLNLVRVEGGSCTLNGQNVTLSSFWISPYEVTQAEFKSIMTGNTNGIASNPSYFPDNPAAGEVQERRPVDTVRWYEAIVYCNLLSIKEGLTPCYTIKGFTDPADWGVRPDSQIHDNYYYWNSVTCDFDANGYRLPTEAEWEYAARGGKPGMTDSSWNNIYSGSTTPDDVAWYTGNSDSKTHEVGKKQANALGLYDMSGNLKEWCWNRESEGNDSRVMGGGYYSSAEGGCQVTAFDSNFPISQSPDQGFRVVRSIR